MRTTTTSLLVLFAGALVLGACESPHELTPGLPVHGDFGASIDAPSLAPRGDDAIAGDIRNAIADSEALTIDAITVTVDARAVRLEGEVATLAAKKRAAAIASVVPGVASVDDRITVLPDDRKPFEILRDVKAELAAAPATSPYDLEVRVHDGVVTLRGQVDSLAEHLAALVAAERTVGVTDVEDEIDVATAGTRADEEIEEDVESLLALDPTLDEEAIDVQVQDGTVELSGTVPSVADALRLTSLAGVEGAVAIDDDRLAVRPFATPPTRARGS